MNLFSQKSART